MVDESLEAWVKRVVKIGALREFAGSAEFHEAPRRVVEKFVLTDPEARAVAQLSKDIEERALLGRESSNEASIQDREVDARQNRGSAARAGSGAGRAVPRRAVRR